jgi:hypothetical protein
MSPCYNIPIQITQRSANTLYRDQSVNRDDLIRIQVGTSSCSQSSHANNLNSDKPEPGFYSTRFLPYKRSFSFNQKWMN